MSEASLPFLKKMGPLFYRRLVMSFLGVVVCSFSVGFFRLSAFGTDPYQCLAAGVANQLPFGFGNVLTGLNVLFFLAALAFGRRYIGIGTLFTVFLTGYIVEFSVWALEKINLPLTLPVRILYLALGVVVMCFAASFYITANMGVSSYDAQAMMLADRKLGPFRYMRIATDLVCVGVGFLLGATVGVGTLITALFMGPLIDFFNARAARPFLMRGQAGDTE